MLLTSKWMKSKEESGRKGYPTDFMRLTFDVKEKFKDTISENVWKTNSGL